MHIRACVCKLVSAHAIIYAANASHTFGRPPAYRKDHKLRKIVGRHVTTLAGGSEEGAADRAGPAGASIWLALDEIRHCSLGARSELAAKSAALTKTTPTGAVTKKCQNFFQKLWPLQCCLGARQGHERGRGKAKCSQRQPQSLTIWC
jgi:hypothetical protein